MERGAAGAGGEMPVTRWLLLLALVACSTTPPVASGAFDSPTGLAVASAGDRDLLFIANSGHDDLRALQLCALGALPDGGVDPNDHCPSQEDLQFLPGPIRVFPATIETADRPVHLGGARLLRADGSRTGAVLAVGADDTVRVVDARNLVEAAQSRTLANPPLIVQVGSPAADVAVMNPVDANGLETNAATVTALVATIGSPALLVELSLVVDPNGLVTQPAIVGQCTLDGVLPRRLAATPAGGDAVYVADGAGDGVVRVAVSSIAAGGACAMDRISAGGRGVRSVALSPQWYDAAGATHPAGELLMMLLEPLPTAPAGRQLDPGGVLFARTADKAIVPVPPTDLFDTSGQQAMEPISPPGMAREATFLPATPPGGTCATPPCTPLFVNAPAGNGNAAFSLLAAVTSTNGSTYFIDVLKRRFVSTTAYQGAVVPLRNSDPVLSQTIASDSPPSFTFLDPDATHPIKGWVTAGVTHSANWLITWHGPMPSLTSRGGTFTATDHGTMLFKMPGLDLTPWKNDPILSLAVGDTVGFGGYQAPAGSPQACVDSASTEAQTPQRFEVPILSFPATDTIEVPTLAPTDTERGFDLSACPGGLGAAATIRAAGAKPWLVSDNGTILARIATGQSYAAPEQRFDYPLDPCAGTTLSPPNCSDTVPLTTDDTALAFVLGGQDPTFPGASWTWSMDNGITPVSYTDVTQLTGLASDVIAYRSARRSTLLFTAITGENALVQADPAILSNVSVSLSGILAYK